MRLLTAYPYVLKQHLRGYTLDTTPYTLISQKVFIDSFLKSQFPHKSVDFFFISVMMKDKLTHLC